MRDISKEAPDEYLYTYSTAENQLQQHHAQLQPDDYNEAKIASANSVLQNVLKLAENVGFKVEPQPRIEPIDDQDVWLVSAAGKSVYFILDGFKIKYGHKLDNPETLELDYDAVAGIFTAPGSDDHDSAPIALVTTIRTMLPRPPKTRQPGVIIKG